MHPSALQNSLCCPESHVRSDICSSESDAINRKQIASKDVYVHQENQASQHVPYKRARLEQPILLFLLKVQILKSC